MTGSLTVTNGTTTVSNVGTITLSSAGTLSGGSSNATITGFGPVDVYIPGDLGTDSDGTLSTISSYQIASETGSAINITWFENNSASRHTQKHQQELGGPCRSPQTPRRLFRQGLDGGEVTTGGRHAKSVRRTTGNGTFPPVFCVALGSD